jgi:hypothetical protein
MTGEHPFPTSSDEEFREYAMAGHYDLARLEGFSQRLKYLLK